MPAFRFRNWRPWWLSLRARQVGRECADGRSLGCVARARADAGCSWADFEGFGDERCDQRGIFSSRNLVRSDLNHAGVETPFRGRAANVPKKIHEDVARLMRLDNGIDPATRGAITNVGLLFVTCLYFGA